MTVSWKKRILGAITAGAIAASLVPAAALGAEGLTKDTSITVGGLTAGDSASFYRIVEQDVDVYSGATLTHQGTREWKLTSAVDSTKIVEGQRVSGSDGIVDYSEDTWFGRYAGSEQTEANKIKGLRVEDLVITGDPTNTDTDKTVITARMSNAIAAAVTANHPNADYTRTNITDTTATVQQSDHEGGPIAGLYMVVATPGTGNPNTVYKPVYVSADYADDGTNAITLKQSEATDASDYKPEADVKATFKRSTLDVDKVSGTAGDSTASPAVLEDSQHDASVGDTLTFTITAPIPTYSENYTNPVFKITDYLTEGLELTGTINVAVAYSDGTAVPVTAGTDYVVTTATNNRSFEVAFKNSNTEGQKDGFLYTVKGAPTVTITYQATVTSAAANLNQMDNTVKLNFSNSPDDTTGAGELRDKTRHYTFNIDAEIFGMGIPSTPGEGHSSSDSEEKSSEVRKITLNADGSISQEIVDVVGESVPQGATYDWLKGAEFELKQTAVYRNKYAGPDTAPSTELETTDLSSNPVTIKFTNGVKSANGTNPTSDDNGYITMCGLDAGKYILREVRAPLGYSYDPNVSYEITITPSYTTEAGSTTDEGDTNLILQSYTVKVEKFEGTTSKGSTTTTYTVDRVSDEAGAPPLSLYNDLLTDGHLTDVAQNNSFSFTRTGAGTNGVAQTTLITNKKLGILPSTGGSGIFFYLGVGGVIAGVAAFLLHKTKQQELTAEQ